ncbi:MAG: S41 family peptidase [Candidatus Saganbacteria bacterium]|nr:S41 family peptidase [Candidatus Saganbacteria bacterium]
MKSKINNKIKYFSASLIVVILFCFLTPRIVKAADDLNSKLQVFIQVLEIVKSDYVDKNVDDQKLIYGAIKGMLESLDDPYTRFMEPTSFKEMKMRMNGSYSGIGIYIGIRNKIITVISPIDGTPAAKAGLMAGDQIVAVEGKPTKDQALEEVVSKIRGPKGTAVKIGILRSGWKAPKDFMLVRDKIVVKSVEKKIFNDTVGYIKLNTFEDLSAAKEMRKAINELKDKKIEGLILDVRGNGGGLLSNAAEISSMFLPKDAVIVYTVDRNGEKEGIRSSGELLWNGPMVVLINEGSASASEILAGALRDNNTAQLIGYHSFGKASVQSVRQLPDGSAALITIAKYLTPSGHDISKKGIIPDIIVKTGKESESKTDMSTEEAEFIPVEKRDEKDVQLKKALEVIKQKIKESSEEKKASE